MTQIFPGVGLGAIVSTTRIVTDSMFLVAADAMATCVSAERFATGAIYPRPQDLRHVSETIARAVVREAMRLRYGRIMRDDQVEEETRKTMWYPEYVEYLAPLNAHL